MKKGVWIWIGIGVLAAAVVAGALWSAGKSDTGSPGLAGLGGSDGAAGPNGSAGATLPAVGGKTTGDAPRTSMSPTSAPQTPAAPTVSEPVAPGSKLVTITTPPERTLAFIDTDAATPGSSYTITFRVYGTGPGLAGTSLVVAIDKSTPAVGVAKPLDLNGRNVLVKVGAEARGVVEVGGTYTGTLVLREQEGTLEPWLVDAEAK